MRKPLISLALSLLAGCAHSEDELVSGCPAELRKLDGAKLAGEDAFAAVAMSGARARDCDVVAIFANAEAEQDTYLARRSYKDPAGTMEISYADSRTCPDMRDALDALANFRSPSVNVPGFAKTEEFIGTFDGTSYAFWTNRMSDSAVNSLDLATAIIHGSNNHPLESLWTEVNAPIEACWTDQSPSPP